MTTTIGYFREEVIYRLRELQPIFNHGPSIRPDLSEMGSAQMPMFLLALISRGYVTEDALYDYVTDHRSRIDRSTLSDMLQRHTTREEVVDGVFDGLWSRSVKGELHPTFTIGKFD